MIDPELLKKLEALGVTPGEARWVETDPLNLNDLPTMQRQRELLVQLRDILKSQLSEDLSKLDAAHEQLERIKNGGGL